MEEYKNNFVFIKRLGIDGNRDITADDFKQAMNHNYYVNEALSPELNEILHHNEASSSGDKARLNEEYEKRHSAITLCNWTDMPASALSQLNVGEVFKGITTDSLMMTYQVVGKDKAGNPLYFPIDTPVEIGIIQRFNPESGEFEQLVADSVNELDELSHQLINEGDLFKVTDIQNEPIDVFDDDIDEDSMGGGIYYCYHNPDDDSYEFKSVEEIIKFSRFYNDFQEKFMAMTGNHQISDTTKDNIEDDDEDDDENPFDMNEDNDD